MFQNKIAYLGFLGFLSIPFLFMKGELPPLLFCLLASFFSFFRFHKKPVDELFWQNVKNAVFHAAIVYVALSLLAFMVLSVFHTWQLPENAFYRFISSYRVYYAIFVLSCMTSGYSMFHFRLKEEVNLDYDEDFGPWQGAVDGKGEDCVSK